MGVTYSFVAVPLKTMKKVLPMFEGKREGDPWEFIERKEGRRLWADKGFGVVYGEIWNRKGPQWDAVRWAFFGPPSRKQDGEVQYLEPNEVVRIVEPACAVCCTCRRPSRSDHNEHRGGLLKRLVQHVDEVGARVDCVDIEEDLISAETSSQVVGEPAGIARRIVSAIADEDPWWHQGLGAVQ